MKKLLLIANPCAGKKKIPAMLPKIAEIFAKGGYETDIRFTLKRGDATELVKTLYDRYDLIVCSGGDGTLNECICGCMALPETVRPKMGYIPAGSTNDFANSLHIPAGILNAARAIAGGEPHALDVGGFEDRYFSYVASFGAFTKSSYATPQSLKNAIGHLAYILDGAKSIGTIKKLPLSVETEEGIIDGDFIFGGICNSTSMGGVVKLKEGLVDFSDGLLELMLIRYPKNAAELAKTVQAVTTSTFDDKSIIFRHCKRAVFHAQEAMDWTLDGEFAKGAEKITVEAKPGAITLVF